MRLLTAALVPALLLPLSTVSPEAVADRDSWKRLRSEAERLYRMWDYENALPLFRKLVENIDKMPGGGADAHARLGDCLFHLGRHLEAKGAYVTCLKLYPSGSGRNFVTLKLADCYVVLGEVERGRKLYSTAPDSPHLSAQTIEERIARLTKRGDP